MLSDLTDPCGPITGVTSSTIPRRLSRILGGKGGLPPSTWGGGGLNHSLIFTGGGAGREVNVYPKCVRGNTFILTSWGKEGDAVQAAKGSTSLTLSPRGAPHTHSYPRSCWLGPGLF